MSTSITVARDVPVPPAEVFRLLADPARHQEFDASGTVGESESPGPLTAAGQLFTMRMSYTDAAGAREEYRTDNRVTMFANPRVLEWSVAPHGGEPLGWRWRYETLPAGDGTRVVLTYDWTDCPEQNLARYGVPLFAEAELAASLDRLAGALT